MQNIALFRILYLLTFLASTIHIFLYYIKQRPRLDLVY